MSMKVARRFYIAELSTGEKVRISIVRRGRPRLHALSRNRRQRLARRTISRA